MFFFDIFENTGFYEIFDIIQSIHPHQIQLWYFIVNPKIHLSFWIMAEKRKNWEKILYFTYMFRPKFLKLITVTVAVVNFEFNFYAGFSWFLSRILCFTRTLTIHSLQHFIKSLAHPCWRSISDCNESKGSAIWKISKIV